MKAVNHFLVALALVTATLFTNVSFAQEKAASLDELLSLVSQAKLKESKEAKKREAEFLQKKNQQARALAQLRQTLRSAENRSERLKRNINDNELKLAEKEKQLTEKLGSLQELFWALNRCSR